MSTSVNTVKMLRRARFAVLDRLLTELEEVNPGPCASHVPMDLLRQLDAHDIGGARQARQRPQPAARGGAAEACQVGAAAAELLGAVGEGVTWILGHMVGRTGVGRLSPQDLRKYFCTSLQEAGVDELLVRQLLGYVSLDTTLRYDRRSLREAVDATWRPAAADLRLGEGRPAPYGLFEKIA
jgi:hypothetical protein